MSSQILRAKLWALQQEEDSAKPIRTPVPLTDYSPAYRLSSDGVTYESKFVGYDYGNARSYGEVVDLEPHDPPCARYAALLSADVALLQREKQKLGRLLSEATTPLDELRRQRASLSEEVLRLEERRRSLREQCNIADAVDAPLATRVAEPDDSCDDFFLHSPPRSWKRDGEEAYDSKRETVAALATVMRMKYHLHLHASLSAGVRELVAMRRGLEHDVSECSDLAAFIASVSAGVDLIDHNRQRSREAERSIVALRRATVRDARPIISQPDAKSAAHRQRLLPEPSGLPCDAAVDRLQAARDALFNVRRPLPDTAECRSKWDSVRLQSVDAGLEVQRCDEARGERLRAAEAEYGVLRDALSHVYLAE